MDADELEIWKALNELPEVKAVFETGYTGDRVYILSEGECITLLLYNLLLQPYHCPPDKVLWIPPLFDPIRPERSLRGLFLTIIGNDSIRWHGCITLKDGRPDLALAKAIIEMEGK